MADDYSNFQTNRTYLDVPISVSLKAFFAPQILIIRHASVINPLNAEIGN